MNAVKGIDQAFYVLQLVLFMMILLWTICNVRDILLWRQYSSSLGSGGLLSGCLHALSGPDHLAAILPTIVGQSWWLCAFYGMMWGLGHSVASGFLAGFGYLLEDSLLQLSWMSFVVQYADIAIGTTLIIIGLMGMLESTGIDEASPTDVNLSVPSSSMKYSTLAIITKSSAILSNGILLGLSWDGLPSLAPALSADSWSTLLEFLISYGLGTLAAMAVVSALIGICTNLLGAYLSNTIPKRLAFSSSVIAVIIGLVWIGEAILRNASVDDRDAALSIINHMLAAGAPIAIIGVILGSIGGDIRITRFCRKSALPIHSTHIV